MTLYERFWEKVDRGSASECWEWEAATHPFGHGKIWYDDEMKYAHRISYMLEREDPGDELVLHKCDNPPCVNPNHLYLGDQADNVRDAFDRGRKSVSGEQHPQSKLTESDVVEIHKQLENGETHASVADEYDVAPSTISMISTGENWGEVDP